MPATQPKTPTTIFNSVRTRTAATKRAERRVDQTGVFSVIISFLVLLKSSSFFFSVAAAVTVVAVVAVVAAAAAAGMVGGFFCSLPETFSIRGGSRARPVDLIRRNDADAGAECARLSKSAHFLLV